MTYHGNIRCFGVHQRKSSMAFPVIHSTLDPQALTKEIESRYALRGPVRCRLMSRANNDFYELTCGQERYALRVAKADFRPREQYAFEAAYVQHLHSKGCRVPVPIPAEDGSLFFEVEAPEGTRAITVMRWLDGENLTKKLSADEAHRAGQSLAQLHRAGEDFVSDHRRDIDTIQTLNDYMPALLAMLDHDPDHRDFYRKATERVVNALAQISSTVVPRGPIHGDFQFANILKTDHGSISVLDFDTCGVGFLAEDLFTFIWRSDMEIRNDAVNDAFLEGYEQIRPLSPDERNLCPLFRVARDLVMSSTFAILINRVGPVPGFDGDFAPFTALAKQHLADAGLT